MQSEPDHLTLLSADSLRLNELLQPRQANMHVYCTTYFYDYDSTRCRNEVHSFHVEIVTSCLFMDTQDPLKPNSSPVSVNTPRQRHNQITGARFTELAKRQDIVLLALVVNVSLRR